MTKFLIDTSIWIDLYEDRKGFNNEPLGEYALKFFMMIKVKENTILITDILIRELSEKYSLDKIRGMIKPFEHLIEKKLININQKIEAKNIAILRNIPFGDVLHAIFARDNDAVLVTRDKHFRQLEDISSHHKPEEII